MSGQILVSFTPANWERALNVFEKDEIHREKMRKRMAENSGRDPEQTRARVGPIDYEIVDELEAVELLCGDVVKLMNESLDAARVEFERRLYSDRIIE